MSMTTIFSVGVTYRRITAYHVVCDGLLTAYRVVGDGVTADCVPCGR